MVQNPPHDKDVLATLACDVAARLAEAPHLADVAAAIRAVCREETALLVDYDPAAAERVGAVVAAERLCCAEIGWHLDGPVSDASTAAGTQLTPCACASKRHRRNLTPSNCFSDTGYESDGRKPLRCRPPAMGGKKVTTSPSWSSAPRWCCSSLSITTHGSSLMPNC
jgi:hypothetical protein